MTKQGLITIAVVILLTASIAVSDDLSYAPATNIRRTMTMLGASTPEEPYTMRILVYGQSISEQNWHLSVRDNLIARFPDADIVWDNRARGGCASECLIDFVDDDVYPFNPDLVIFHVYGSHTEYENIINAMRNHVNPSGAKTEVLIWNDHYNGSDAWADTMSYMYVPGFASTYKCGFIDVRHPWIDYIVANYPECYPDCPPEYPPDYYPCTIDGIHLDDEGNALLASLIIPYLIYDPNWGPSKPFLDYPKVFATDVSVNVDLSWIPGVDADYHEVYTGLPMHLIGRTSKATFDPGPLLPNKKYYWRIDEVNSYATTQGGLWLFTTGTGAGTGLKAEYYNNADLTELVIERTDRTVNFDWDTGSPHPAVNPDSFSVRWTGRVEPLYSETYTFYTNTDDGVRLWVDNVLIIDKWIDQGQTEWNGSIALTAGTLYDIKMEYYDSSNTALAQLSWESTSQAKEVIPQAYLHKYLVTGDLQLDYDVDLSDADIFFNQWLDTGDCSADPNCADLDGNNDVNFIDFAMLGENLGL